jgi:hypothetical protein
MTRKPIRWVDALKRIFSPLRIRKKQQTTRLAVEQLDDRIVPHTYNPSPDGVVSDGDPNSLRDVITQANSINDSNIIINLAADSTYTLTVDNTGGQENNNSEGDLDIQDLAGVAGGKTYTFVGVGGNRVPIQQTVMDRVFQIIGPGVTVDFRNVFIVGG